LTGVPLSPTDPVLGMSFDRIDPKGPYSRTNLQVSEYNWAA
jgi:hypothetical protein